MDADAFEDLRNAVHADLAPSGAVEAQGRYAEAEPFHQCALAIKEKALGPDHADVATSLNNLAELYRTQGRYAEAEPVDSGVTLLEMFKAI